MSTIEPADLMGAAEVAAYLGWKPSRVADYWSKRAAGIPDPIIRLKCGPIWRRSDIEEWALERGYRT